MLRFVLAFLAGVLLSAAVAWSLLVFCAPVDPAKGNLWIEAYQLWARAPVFTAFVTLGSFLLTLKTAIIQRLREAYESEDYIEIYLTHRENFPNGEKQFYASLQRIGWALGVSVLAALTTSASQLTLGFVPAAWAIAICMALPATTLVAVGYLTWNIIKAHDGWYLRIEEDMQKKLKEQIDAIDERRRKSGR